MNMNRQSRNPDQDIINLLGRMKDTGPEYPPRMWTERRAAVLAGLAVVPAAVGLMAIPWIARLVKMIKAMTIIDKVILTVEVATITGLTGYGAVTAYQYRYQLQQLLLPSTIHTPFPTLMVPPTLPPAQATESAQETSTAATETAIATVTPLPTWTAQALPPGVPQSTPVPGQPTPKPPLATPKPPEPEKTKPGIGRGLTEQAKPATNTPKPPKP